MKKIRSTVCAFAIFILTACGGGGTTTPPTEPMPIPTPSPTPTPTPTPTPPTAPPDPVPEDALTFDEVLAYGNNDYSYIIGTVTNHSDRNMEFLKFIATLYDGANNFLGSEFTYSDLDIVKPGETTPFKIISTDFASFQKFDLQAEWNYTTEEPFRLEVKNLRLQSGNFPRVSGQATNTSNIALEFVKIILTCYRDDKLVAVDFAYADLDTLAAGATSPFTTYVIAPFRDPQECTAVAQGKNY